MLFHSLSLIAALLVAEPQRAFFSVSAHRGYPAPRRTLEQLVMARGTASTNRFCVVGYRDAGGDEYAWAHWTEGNALILWEPVADPKHPPALASSRRFIRLDRDVVASEDDLRGSTYLVTQQWVRGIESDCRQHGERFTVHLRKRH